MNTYLSKYDYASLHPKLTKVHTLPLDPCNFIFYGPPGVGKYTQMLAHLRNYSPSELKYEKRVVVKSSKLDYQMKISDIHFEIDMGLLGCNAKTMWNDIYINVVDVILARSNKIGFIVCKNFHETPADLLQSFYSYMQTLPNNSFEVNYILLTEHLSFIPDNILNRCSVINVPRPTKTTYNDCTNTVITLPLHNVTAINGINNPPKYIRKCMLILSHILDADKLCVSTLREQIYDLLVYNLNIYDCTWFILNHLISNGHIQPVDVGDVLLYTYNCFVFYNNNYRPIYHLERLIVYFIIKVHGYGESTTIIKH